MCRWSAYLGQPLLVGELLFGTQHGLIDQRLHARLGVETTNGDGFGLGWYGTNGAPPGRHRGVAPAWSDGNLRELAAHIESPLFLAHVRCANGTPVHESDCHPFRQGRWLFVHNGMIAGFRAMRRELLLAVDDALFHDIVGASDSEALFYLALTFGLEDDPLGALERAVGFVEANARKSGIEQPVQMTVGMSDGERLWAVRYSSDHKSPSLFVSQHVDALRRLRPGHPHLQPFTDEDRVVVSAPPGDLPGAWLEVPESTAIVLHPGADEHLPFRPHWP